MIIDKILMGITEEEKSRARTSPLRMSASGHCGRKIAYQLHQFEAEPLSSRAIMVFRLGDTVEAELRLLIDKYCKDLPITFPKEAISYEIDGVKIEGHVDGLIGEDTVLEVKSINGMRFKSLDRMGIPEDYQRQAVSYMKALKRTKTLFIFYCKDTSHVKEMTLEYDDSIWREVELRFKRVIASTKDDLPFREFEPLKSGQLPYQCSYCSYTSICWSDYQLKFDKNNKPQWVRK